ncbi:MAG: ABC transporter ATP-binding protein [Anaerolineaceae bacterium]|nr:ABC transporter ATP-binding protein [Anaerolineaceae bacterium]
MPAKPLFSIRDLDVEYHTRGGDVRAVESVSFDIRRGEILGLVGESACGKSTMGKALMRLHRKPARITNGQLLFDGRDLMTLTEDEMRFVRGGEIGMVFQDPMASLNPVQKIIEHLTETIHAHEPNTTNEEAHRRAGELAEKLGIRSERLNEYPHQMSGGMRQRVMISLALALRAKLVIADEPTTSLDVIVEANFLDLLRELRHEFDLTILLITHNIGVVAEICDRVAVMYAAHLVEIGDVRKIFTNPKHPYTRGLLRSVPNIDLDDKDLYKMEGAPPSLLDPPSGCRFHPRCPDRMKICSRKNPVLQKVGSDSQVACWLYSKEGKA